MRRKIHSKINDSFDAIWIMLIILLFIIFISSTTVCSQEEQQLIIDVMGEVSEDGDFVVSVYTLEEGYLTDVEIEFDGKPYQITAEDENGEITLTAPQVSEDSSFTITASKAGYLSAEKTIAVLNILPILSIYLDEYTVDADEWFSVRLTDDSGKAVEGVTDGIQSVVGAEYEDTTNADGRARLLAPKEKDSIVVKAQKTGYTDGSTELWINAEPGLWKLIQQNKIISAL